jgi:hypothetical protein
MKSLHKSFIITLIILIVVLLIVGVYFYLKLTSNTSFKEEDSREIRNLLAMQYKVESSQIVISPDKTGYYYAHGNFYTETGEPAYEEASGTFWAVKKNGAWVIVFAGNGYITCKDLATEGVLPSISKGYCYVPE